MRLFSKVAVTQVVANSTIFQRLFQGFELIISVVHKSSDKTLISPLFCIHIDSNTAGK
jgi:hypothetical protein